MASYKECSLANGKKKLRLEMQTKDKKPKPILRRRATIIRLGCIVLHHRLCR